jgi:hypothetical protein
MKEGIRVNVNRGSNETQKQGEDRVTLWKTLLNWKHENG